MSGRKDRGKKRVEVQDDLVHNPFAASLAERFAEPGPQDEEAEPIKAPGAEADPAKAPETLRFAAKVILRREKKGRGGKTVTRVEGLLGSPALLKKTAQTLGKALGARAFVEDETVLVSGDQCQSARAWFEKAGAPRVIVGN